jgi:predicted nucleic acid-binding protein
LLAKANTGYLQLVYISAEYFHRTCEMRQKYDDTAHICFVDFTSMVVMQELDITDVSTGDDHFRQVGLGFHLIPQDIGSAGTVSGFSLEPPQRH